MVRSGLDVLLAQACEPLQGKRIGLVTHAAAVDRDFRTSVEALASQRGVRLETIFGPEHGLHGQAQDLIGVRDDESRATARVVSLYGDSAASLRPTPRQLEELDLLVVDLQDVGSRYYTFQATMKYCLEVALPLGLRVLVLDRPNPIGGLLVEGPLVRDGHASFVGVHPVSIRHGLTIGELSLLYQQSIPNSRGEVQVVRCEGWSRDRHFADCGLPWVLPSPNMPTPDTALVYPGQCLVEGTNLSEGRGTTRPFEISGAPWIDAGRLARSMEALDLPGVRFRPVWFRPTFHKHAGSDCGGVQIHVVDREKFRPVRTSLALLVEMRRQAPEKFSWRTETYEFVSKPIAIDLLFGSPREREAIEQGAGWQDIAQGWEADEETFRMTSHAFWIY